MMARFPLRTAMVAVVAMILVLSMLFFSEEARQYLPDSIASVAKGNNRDSSDKVGAPSTERGSIPNIAHFVYILPDPQADFTFQFSHYLSIYSAWYHWRPATIYLHTNAGASDKSVTRARQGESGKWNKLIFNIPGLKVNTVDVPSHANNGNEIKGYEHRSDFVRVRAVHDMGGVYIDWDVHVLRDIKVLRESGFRAIAGRQLGGQINSGTFMSEKEGRMIGLWRDGMHEAYNGGWTTHSNEVITKFGERLVAQPGEMLIMEREAFAPGSWEAGDNDMLFAVHKDVESNLANITTAAAVSAGGETKAEEQQPQDRPSLALHDESFTSRWDHPENYPDWARDWSRTYLLHAFDPNRFGHDVEGYENVTPRYVLERQSNFARAVYPIARELYEQGVINIDDAHEDVRQN